VGRCVFCGWEGKLTQEHAWPDWLRDELPRGNDVGFIQGQRLIRDQGKIVSTTPLRRETAANRKVRVVCQQNCNGGWMSRLESRIKPVLLALLHGERRHLSDEDQRLLAFWALKTAMMLQFTLALDLRAVPASHYEYIYQRRQAPPSCRVWLTGTSAHFYRTAHFATSHWLPLVAGERPVPSEEPPNGYAIALVVGQLIFTLVGWTAPGGSFNTTPQDRWTPARRCIWPPRPSGWAWPPDVLIGTVEDVQRFCFTAMS
jgi:hypothetical protein